MRPTEPKLQRQEAHFEGPTAAPAGLSILQPYALVLRPLGQRDHLGVKYRGVGRRPQQPAQVIRLARGVGRRPQQPVQVSSACPRRRSDGLSNQLKLFGLLAAWGGGRSNQFKFLRRARDVGATASATSSSSSAFPQCAGGVGGRRPGRSNQFKFFGVPVTSGRRPQQPAQVLRHARDVGATASATSSSSSACP
jgi:hypothetical protein